MKKYYTYGLLFLLLVLMTGSYSMCGGYIAGDTDTDYSSPTPEPKEVEEIRIKDIYTKKYVESLKYFSDSSIAVSYDMNNEMIFIYLDASMGPVVIKLTNTQRELVLGFIDKYFEWYNKATKKGVTLDKEIGHLSFETLFKYGDDWHSSYQELPVQFSFFSRNTSTHELVIQSGKVSAKSNEYMDANPYDFYLSYENVKELQNSMSEKTLNKKIKEYRKQKNIESEFK